MSNPQAIMNQLLSESTGAVGVRVQPRRLAGVAIQPRRLGAAAQMVQQVQSEQGPVNYSPAEYQIGDVTYLGFGRFVATSTPGLLTNHTPDKKGFGAFKKTAR